MIGWEPVPAIPGGHEDVYRCTVENCGALVRARNAGRQDHDRAFHVITVAQEKDGHNDGYVLRLDGREVGDVHPYEKRYNLRRVVVDRGWVVRFRDHFHPSVTSGDTRREVLDIAVQGLGAKAWGVGKRPTVFHYPSPVTV